MVRRLPIGTVRPTQLYLSSGKLADVCGWFDFADPNYDPLPAFEHEGEWYLADGHTRAFAAALAGADHLRVERDETLREVTDFEVYLRSIEWCAAADVFSVHDLFGRVVAPEAYEERWVARCQRVTG